MTECQGLNHFLGGLKLELQAPVRMVQPRTVCDAFSLAKWHESMLGVAMDKQHVHHPRYTATQESIKLLSHAPIINPLVQLNNPGGNIILTNKEIEVKRAKGLCFVSAKKNIHLYINATNTIYS